MIKWVCPKKQANAAAGFIRCFDEKKGRQKKQTKSESRGREG
jgi:hypothetical protein